MCARRLYQNGDILTAQDVNAIAYPNLSGADAIGSGDKLPDSDLSNAPDQIKSRFYNFYDRLKVSHAGGLTFSYLGGSVLLSSGATVTISAGTINLPDNSNRYIYVNGSGAIESASTLPNECFPMARVATAGGTISNTITDLRDKLVDRIQPSNIPPVTAFQPGMGMEWWGATLPAGGWLWQDGAEYDISAYPALDAALGPAFRTGGGKFRVPDRRGRAGVGAGQGAGLTSRTVGETFGEERVTLTVTETPSHSHSITETPHSHGVTQQPHGHGTTENQHSHGYIYRTEEDVGTVLGYLDRDSNNNYRLITINGSTAGATTGLTVNSANANIAINGAATGITVNPQGGGGSHNNCQPSIAVNYIIKI